jgi:hypothetical protein
MRAEAMRIVKQKYEFKNLGLIWGKSQTGALVQGVYAVSRVDTVIKSSEINVTKETGVRHG